MSKRRYKIHFLDFFLISDNNFDCFMFHSLTDAIDHITEILSFLLLLCFVLFLELLNKDETGRIHFKLVTCFSGCAF